MNSLLTRFSCLAILALVIIAASVSTAAAQQTAGLFVYDQSAASPGYTLFAPAQSTTTYLIDMYGRYVHSWHSGYTPGMSVYLLGNGNLLRTESLPGGSGNGGRLEEIDWSDNIVWDYELSNDEYLQHHDVEPMPNGNILLVAWEFFSDSVAFAAGRDTLLLDQPEIQITAIIEVQPTGSSGGDVVWEWHLFDHIIQDFDSTKANYGVVADHPELIDFNFTPNGNSDWIHANAVDYNADLDQIVFSSRSLCELYVIDHSTTTAEAAGHSGGNSGKGGDILYRWGNPQAYRAGSIPDQKLYQPHDARWIPDEYPGAGNFLVFNNGDERPSGQYSSVEEIVPPVDGSGNYTMPSPGSPYSPTDAVWTYVADPPTSFFSANRSGAQRLANGNTLICEARHGDYFEVTSSGETVWRYVNPVKANGPVQQGAPTNGNGSFRCTRYPVDFPGFVGRDLTPRGAIELYPIEITYTENSPESPLSTDSVTITALIEADSALTSVQVYADAGSGFSATAMYDDGNHHDGAPGDSVYGAVLPPNASASTVPYYIAAADVASNSVSDPYIAPDVTYEFSVMPAPYTCGDADGSGDVDIDDVVYLIAYIFSGGATPNPLISADSDCSSEIDIDDVVYLISFIFSGGPSPCDPDGNGIPDC